MQLYIFLADAYAANHATIARGAHHALNVIVRAPSLEVAAPVARARLTGAGWERITLGESNTVREDIETIPDPTLRAAAGSALQTGYAIVEYNPAID